MGIMTGWAPDDWRRSGEMHRRIYTKRELGRLGTCNFAHVNLK